MISNLTEWSSLLSDLRQNPSFSLLLWRFWIARHSNSLLCINVQPFCPMILFLFLNLKMVPWNSTSGGFAYIWQSKWVGIIAISTKRALLNSRFKRRSRCRRIVGSYGPKFQKQRPTRESHLLVHFFFRPLQDIRREIFIATFFREPTLFPKVQPLPFYIPFLTEKVLLSYTFYWQMLPLSQT